MLLILAEQPLAATDFAPSSSFDTITASLLIIVSTGGLSAVQPTAPAQRYTASSGQRAYTYSDILNQLNDTINGNTDPTSDGPDSPDTLYTFDAESDGTIIIDAMLVTPIVLASDWDNGIEYVMAAWG